MVAILQATSFRVIIQAFGGAGVGRWTLEVEVPAPGSGVFFEFCDANVTSGQIRIRLD